MATLYVENVPDDLYEAVRNRAKLERSSIAAVVIEVLKQSIPTETVLKRRREAFKEILKFQAQKPLKPGPHPSTEEMLREDRER